MTVHEPPLRSGRGALWVLAISALGALLYASGLSNGYVLDDVKVVERNAVVSELRWGEVWSLPWWPPQLGMDVGASNWRPLTLFSFLADGTLARSLGVATNRVHHAWNAVFYGMVILALAPLVRRFLGRSWTSILVLVVFAAHPAHTEAVFPVVGRADLLGALGVLIGLESFLLFREGRGGRWLFVSALAYALGVGAKEMALPLIGILVAADLWLRDGSPRRLFGRESLAYLPHAAVLLLYLVARFQVLGSAAFDHAHAADYSAFERWTFASRNALVGLGLLVAPVSFHHLLTTLPSSAPYTYPLPDGASQILVALGGLVLGLGWLGLVRRAPRGAFLWVASLLPWLPSSGLLPTSAGTSLRFLFVPSAFFVIAVACWVRTWRPQPWHSIAAFLALVWAGWGTFVTLQRAEAWRHNGAFYEALLAEEPRCFVAQSGLGSFYLMQNPPDIARAREHLGEAIRITGRTPESGNARIVLGMSHEIGTFGVRHQGPGLEYDRAIEIYRELIEIDPGRWDAHLSLADILKRKGEELEAARHMERAVLLNPGYPKAAEVLESCAEIHSRLGDTAEAQDLLWKIMGDYRESDVAERVRQRMAPEQAY